jgi:membrane-associated phospholipid phosphatase
VPVAAGYCRLAAGATLAVATAAHAGGPLLIDHALTPTDSGIWARHNTLGLEYAVSGVALGSALWLGAEDEAGKTAWQQVDAMVLGQIGAQAAKYAFGRERPSRGRGPDAWFHGLKAQSFPSGEVTLQASFAAPLIVHYAERDPWVWALELLPAYDAAARVKEGGHWQSDVLAGWALGSAFGFWAAHNSSPVILGVLPHGFEVGLRRQF